MKYYFLLILSIFTLHFSFAQQQHPLEGRWDLEIEILEETRPSWLEVKRSGDSVLVGRFVYLDGSARPISEVVQQGNQFTFSIPRQWEKVNAPLFLRGEIKNKELTGVMISPKGETVPFKGYPRPNFAYKNNPILEKPIMLHNGKNLEGWYLSNDEGKWVVESGILKNENQEANLISKQKFTDFMLTTEFRYPAGSNSGIYLRGRYEVQIADNHGLEPSDIYFGGIYGFLEPNENVAKPAGEWQNYEITLIGDRVTIVANGITIIKDQTIPGITGGALDSNEGEPGPIMIQGDHGPIEFKSFVVTPIK